jgi:hypothetical protein
MTHAGPTPQLIRTIASHAAVAAATVVLLSLVYLAMDTKDTNSVSVDQMLDQMVVESDDERRALRLILTGEADNVAQGRRILETSALLGRPTAQRHLATYWALTESPDNRSHVYQWLLIALACARGIDREAGTATEINYLLFLTNIALIEHSTPDRDKDRGRQWAKGWLEANSDAPGLASCDGTAIDDYGGG